MLDDKKLKTIGYELLLRSYYTPDNKPLTTVRAMNYGMVIHMLNDMFPDTIPEVVFDQLVFKLKEDLMLKHIITKELPLDV